jgi:hypothetical protein
MTILLVVGVAVVIFGALVLLRFPDRPGGKIAWHGAEVSSIGAGLPLIVVGIAAIAIAGGGAIGGGSDGGDGAGASAADRTTTTTTAAAAPLGCPSELAKSLPSGRIRDVETGADAQIVFGPADSHVAPFGLRFTEGGETIGAMTVRFFPESDLFKVVGFVDARCRPSRVEFVDGGQTDALRNGSNYRLPDLQGHVYVLNLTENGSDVRVNFQPGQ